MNFKEIVTLHQQVSPQTLISLEKNAMPYILECGETMMKQGEVCDAFVFNASGVLRVGLKQDGNEFTVAFGTAGDIYTSLHSYFAGEPAAFSLSAIERSEGWLISYSDMNRLLTKHPDLLKWLLQLAIGQLYCLEKRFVNFASSNATTRYKNYIGYFNKDTRQVKEPWFAQRIPLKFVAQYLGIAPASLSRIRRELILNSDND